MFKTIKELGRRIKSAGRAVKDIVVHGATTGGVYGGQGEVSFGGSSYDSLVKRAMTNPISNRAIRFIHENMSAIPLEVEEVKGDGSTETVDEHEALERLKNPAGDENKRYTKDWIISKLTWALHGGGEWWIRSISPEGGMNEGRPQKLQVFDRSDFVRFKTDRDGFVNGYELKHQLPHNIKMVDGDTEEIHHAFLYNPRRIDRGLPILKSIMRHMELFEDADEWNKNITKNKGQLTGFMKPVGLEPGDQLDKETLEQAQESLDRSINKARAKNSWKILSGSYEPMDRGITPKEASFIESLKFYGSLISIGLGIDPVLTIGQAKTYNNYTTANIMAHLITIIPQLEFHLSHLNRWYMPKFEDEGQNLRLTFDPMKIDAIREANLEKIEAIVNAVNGPILTPDEGRNILGYDEVLDEDDGLVMPMNIQPHEMAMGSVVGSGGQMSIGKMTDEEVEKQIDRILDGDVKTDMLRSNGHV